MVSQARSPQLFLDLDESDFRGILTLTCIHEAEAQGALPLGSQSFTTHSPLCPVERVGVGGSA